MKELRRFQAFGMAELASPVAEALRKFHTVDQEKEPTCMDCEHYDNEKAYCCLNDNFCHEDNTCDEFVKY